MTTAGTKKQFFPALESLRGLAALSVVFTHCFVSIRPGLGYSWQTFRSGSLSEIINYLLIIPFNGRNAVVMFFVLSGFVLSASLSNRLFGGNQRKSLSTRVYAGFLSARFFRLYPPATVVTLISCLYLGLDVSKYYTYVSDWIVVYLAVPSHLAVAQALLYLQPNLNPTYWTLKVELVIALIFPLLFAFFWVCSWIVGLLSLPIFVILGTICFQVEFVRFTLCFVAGILTYRLFKGGYGQWFIDKNRRALILMGTLLLLISRFLTENALVQLSVESAYMVKVCLETLGAVFLILIVCQPTQKQDGFSKFLNHPFVMEMGRISYSIYLLQFFVIQLALLVCNRVFGELCGRFPLIFEVVTASLTFPTLIVLSRVTYNYVELRGIRIAKKVGNHIAGSA